MEMEIIFLWLLALGSPLFFFVIRTWMKQRRRDALRKAPFSDEWKTILSKNIPAYSSLPKKLKKKLHLCIQIFLDEKSFEGCGGFEVTDEVRVTIAGQACFLIMNKGKEIDGEIYPRLQSILVYPTAYRTSYKKSILSHENWGSEDDEDEIRLGESWSTGSVVLAWDSVLHGAHDWSDGQNVVLHEFAHQLDQIDGSADGAPILEQRSRYVSWARVLGEEYEDLVERIERGSKTDFDPYGATNPAEFFAVITESFFEKPKKMKRKHPELYRELKSYYRLDPLKWKRC